MRDKTSIAEIGSRINDFAHPEKSLNHFTAVGTRPAASYPTPRPPRG